MEWISVKDKIPKHGTYCVAYCGSWGYYLVQYDECGRRHHWAPMCNGCGYANSLMALENISHWTPLTKPNENVLRKT